jgi:3-hydroxyisobutyrate dehydrogenase
MRQKLGFIGVGNMGGPMGGHLLKAGHELLVYDSNPAAAAKVAAAGASMLGSVKELADQAETVFLCLPTPQIVEQVALGPGGVLEGGKVRTVVDLSTIGPRTAVAVAAGLAKRGIAYVDSPISGGVPGAVKATLAVMVSCPRPLYDALQPVLANFGKTFFLGEKPGQAPKVMIDVINAGSGRNTASADKFPRCVLPRTFDVGFKAALAYKDVRLCVDEAEHIGAPMVVGSAVREMLSITLAVVGKDADFSEVVKVCEAWAGVEVRG